MNLPLQTATEVRGKLWKISDWYNSEDGQIRWLEDNNYNINLWNFYSIVPQEIKEKMSEWNKMSLPLQTASEVRGELWKISDWYNSEDGQIRWLEDNNYDIHLWNFYTIIPQEIKEKMNHWKYTNLTFLDAKKKYWL